jgi:hypothetical protein
VAKKSKASKTWTCSGMPENSHDPFDNFGPDCSVCGAKREDIIGTGKGSGKGGGSTSGKLPIVPIVAGCGIGLLVLGGGWFASPNLGGICEITDNCAAWDQDLSKAQKLASESKAVADKKESQKAELESARSKISRAIALLNPLKQKSSTKAKALVALAEAQSTQTQLDEKIAKMGPGTVAKPTPTPKASPSVTPTPGGGGTKPGDSAGGGAAPEDPTPSREREYTPPAPEPRYEPVYVPPAPVAEAPRYELPEERPSSSAPPRDEQLIPN